MLLVAGLCLVSVLAVLVHAARRLEGGCLSRFDTGRAGGEWAAVLSERAGLRLRLEHPGGTAGVRNAYLPFERRVVLSRGV